MKTPILPISLAGLLLILPSCVFAVGNSATGTPALPDSTAPLLEEKVQAAERVVALREQQLDRMRAQVQEGTLTEDAVLDAQIALQEAKINQLQLRAELAAMNEREKD